MNGGCRESGVCRKCAAEEAYSGLFTAEACAAPSVWKKLLNRCCRFWAKACSPRRLRKNLLTDATNPKASASHSPLNASKKKAAAPPGAAALSYATNLR